MLLTSRFDSECAMNPSFTKFVSPLCIALMTAACSDSSDSDSSDTSIDDSSDDGSDSGGEDGDDDHADCRKAGLLRPLRWFLTVGHLRRKQGAVLVKDRGPARMISHFVLSSHPCSLPAASRHQHLLSV